MSTPEIQEWRALETIEHLFFSLRDLRRAFYGNKSKNLYLQKRPANAFALYLATELALIVGAHLDATAYTGIHRFGLRDQDPGPWLLMLGSVCQLFEQILRHVTFSSNKFSSMPKKKRDRAREKV
jgi:hypothetical protein